MPNEGPKITPPESEPNRYSPSTIALAFVIGAANGFLVNEYLWYRPKDNKLLLTEASLRPSPPPEVSVPLSEMIGKEDHTARPGSMDRRPLDCYFIADAAKEASPAVVAIQTHIALGSLFGPIAAQAFGSGFIIDPKGTVVTNAHVVALAADDSPVMVTLSDGSTFQATVVARDKLSDLAVLRIVNTEQRTFPCVKFGNSAVLRPGEWVTAIGSPLSLQNSISAGVLSNVDRSDYELGIENRLSYLQFDAGITQGNSGGPLVNLNGEVVGVNCMKAMDSTIGFAIPIDAAKDIVTQLLEKGKVERPHIGVSMIAINPSIKAELAKQGFSFPDDVDNGVLVADVVRNGPAARAGLKPDDIIVGINGNVVRTSKDVLRLLGAPGKPVEFKIIRRNKGMVVRVIPDPLPERLEAGGWGPFGR